MLIDAHECTIVGHSIFSNAREFSYSTAEIFFPPMILEFYNKILVAS